MIFGNSSGDIVRWNTLPQLSGNDITSPLKQLPNCKKQAQQIRYCLRQAEEYFSASDAVSLATQPLLQYYGTMSLAIAEFLLKQDGTVSLDRARGTHGHHGLEFSFPSQSVKAGSPERMDGMIALPHVGSFGRRGTFELWHRSANEYPIVGLQTDIFEDYHSKGYGLAATASTERLPLISENGISLRECFSSLPFLFDSLYLCGINPNFARGRAETEINRVKRTLKREFTLNATPEPLLTQVAQGFEFPPAFLRNLELQEYHSGFRIALNLSEDEDRGRFEGYDAVGRYPATVQYSAEEVFYYGVNYGLNEFGYIYVALFILGNLARYYPDKWMEEVERSTALSSLVDYFLAGAKRRAPLLVLSEFDDMLIVDRSMHRT